MTGSSRIRAALLLLAPLVAGCLDVKPFAYSTVRVQVNDQAGAGLPSVHVVLYTTGRVVEDALTDAGGRATFIRVPLGNFGIGVEPPAGYVIPSGGSDHTDAIRIASGTDTTFTFVFDRACCGGSQVRVAGAGGGGR